MINIHPSLLPAIPGLHTHRRALADGVRMHGCTVHFVTPEVDVGPIVAQAAVPVRDDDDEDALAARVLAAEHVLLPRVVRWYCAGRLVIDGARGSTLGSTAVRRDAACCSRPAAEPQPTSPLVSATAPRPHAPRDCRCASPRRSAMRAHAARAAVALVLSLARASRAHAVAGRRRRRRRSPRRSRRRSPSCRRRPSRPPRRSRSPPPSPSRSARRRVARPRRRRSKRRRSRRRRRTRRRARRTARRDRRAAARADAAPRARRGRARRRRRPARRCRRASTSRTRSSGARAAS